MHIIDRQPDKHWGSYQSVDHGYDNRVREVAMGTPPSLPALPGSAPDLSALVFPEVRGQLQFVRSDLQPHLVAALNMTDFVPTSGPHVTQGTIQLTASVVGQNWLQAEVGAGGAVMVDILSVTQGPVTPSGAAAGPMFVLSKDPQEIARFARPGGPLLIVAIAPGMEAAAQQAVPPTPVPVVPPTPGPPVPPPPGPPPGAPPAPPPPSEIPPEALVGGGVFVLVLVGLATYSIYTSRRK